MKTDQKEEQHVVTYWISDQPDGTKLMEFKCSCNRLQSALPVSIEFFVGNYYNHATHMRRIDPPEVKKEPV
jgi:hypothetical protein